MRVGARGTQKITFREPEVFLTIGAEDFARGGNEVGCIVEYIFPLNGAGMFLDYCPRHETDV